MRAVVVEGAFGLENLKRDERESPRPGPGQVRLEMRAASLNYRDLLMVQGRYNPRQPLPLVPGSDGAGTVVEIGDGVQRVAVGDRVCPIFAQSWLAGEDPAPDALRSTLGGPLDGTLREQMVLDAEGVVRIPDHLTDEEAACLPCAATTAWNALVTHGGVTAGDTVLIQGTGGVSIAALQFARVLGARAIVTSSSDDKLERARALGAWQTVNYRRFVEWSIPVREFTDGRGVDLVVEVGGGRTLEQSIRSVRAGGRICMIGVVSGRTCDLDVTPVFMRQIRLQGILVGNRSQFESMLRAVAQHEIRPAVSRVFPLDQVSSAFEHLASGEHFGKVCVRLS